MGDLWRSEASNSEADHEEQGFPRCRWRQRNKPNGLI